MTNTHVRGTLTAAVLLSLTACATDTGLLATASRFAEFTANIEVAGGGTLTLEEAMAHHGVHGVSVVVIDQGRAQVQAHHGVENTLTGASTDTDTVYQAASLSKLVAGLAMAKADRTGAMSLDMPLTDHVRANIGGVVSGWHARNFRGDRRFWAEHVTPRRLLQHAGGTDTGKTGTSCDIDDTRIEAFLGQDGGPVCSTCVGIEFEAGTKTDYSSGGYVLAEAMFEEHVGSTGRKYLNEEVLEPYGLTDSTFRNSTSGVAHLATGCDKPLTSTGLCACTHEIARVKFPGGLLAKPLDYAQLLVLIMNDGRDADGDEVIPLSDIEQVLTPAVHRDDGGEPLDNEGHWRGLGVNLTEDYLASDGLPAELYQSGGQSGFSTYFNIDRSRRNGVVIFINGPEGDDSRTRKGLRRDIIDAFECVYREDCD